MSKCNWENWHLCKAIGGTMTNRICTNERPCYHKVEEKMTAAPVPCPVCPVDGCPLVLVRDAAKSPAVSPDHIGEGNKMVRAIEPLSGNINAGTMYEKIQELVAWSSVVTEWMNAKGEA